MRISKEYITLNYCNEKKFDPVYLLLFWCLAHHRLRKKYLMVIKPAITGIGDDDYSLPDPTIIEGGDGYYYLYATRDIRNLPIHRSSLINWGMGRYGIHGSNASLI